MQSCVRIRMKESSQTCYVVVQITMWMCKYIHKCASESLCEEKYASLSTTFTTWLLCKVIGESMSAFVSV